MCQPILTISQGEYNINYSFTHPKTGKKLLLRVNCGSQMHLENQIGYECHALQLLEASGRTPKVLYVDGSRKFLDHGVLVMEYLLGVTVGRGRKGRVWASEIGLPVAASGFSLPCGSTAVWER